MPGLITTRKERRAARLLLSTLQRAHFEASGIKPKTEKVLRIEAFLWWVLNEDEIALTCANMADTAT
jgi:hypothetical protein